MMIGLLVLLACGSPSPPPAAPPPPPPLPAQVPEPEPEPEPELAAPEPLPVQGAAALANQLVEVERTLRDPAHSGPVLDAWGHLQQRIYRALTRDPALEAEVLAALPQDLREVVRLNTAATRDASGTVTRRRSSLPDWTIAPPTDADTLVGHYRAAEAETGVQWSVLAAIHLVETRTSRLRGLSHVGARGPMQFMPATWEAYGEGDIDDDRDAIFAAARYLHARGAPDKLDKALWAYNQSDRYVRAVRGYASVLDESPLAYRGYHGWEVWYRTTLGVVWLPVGYSHEATIPVGPYCESHPDRCPDAPVSP
ncbi:MAG: hypothetical protein ACI8PZ_005722 [Myxococcota bacterium]|jgi:hypothetical protein